MSTPFMDLTQVGENVQLRVRISAGEMQTRYLTKNNWMQICSLMAQIATEKPDGENRIYVPNPFRGAKKSTRCV